MRSHTPPLDLRRANAWMQSNRRALQLSREAPYQWLVAFFQELSWPGNDPRWNAGPLRGLLYLSWEPKHENFLLRRAFPFHRSFLPLSQCVLPSGVVEHLFSGDTARLDDLQIIQPALVEARGGKNVRLRCLAIPATARRGLQGVLLVIYERTARLPAPSSLKTLGGQLGAFSLQALHRRRTGNVRAS